MCLGMMNLGEAYAALFQQPTNMCVGPMKERLDVGRLLSWKCFLCSDSSGR